MARVSDGILPNNVWSDSNTSGTQMGLTLDRYQEILTFAINGFNGVNEPDERTGVNCDRIWSQSSRNRLAMAILRAEQKREQELGFFIGHKYVTDEIIDMRYNPRVLNWKHLVGIGVPTNADIAIGTATNLGGELAPNDPVTITAASTVAAAEVRVYYPDEDIEIHPSSVTTDGVTITVQIPRARLLKPALMTDSDDYPSYYENDNFLATVDVKRLYLDPTEGAQYVWRKPCLDGTAACTMKYQTACARIMSTRAYRLSTFSAEPATYADGAWTTACWSYNGRPDQMIVTYESGVNDMNNLTLTAKLAHTLMGYSPCDCKAVSVVWMDDREQSVPRVYTPYGSRQGAIDAWMEDSRNKVGAGGMVPRVA